MDTTTIEEEVLSANDRCDSCNAQAYVHVYLLEGDLLFCAHHFKKNEETLARKAVRVHNESHRLYPTPTNEQLEEALLAPESH